MGKIHEAALKGDIAEVTRLLDEGGALKVVTQQGGAARAQSRVAADQAVLESNPGAPVDADDYRYDHTDGGGLIGRWCAWRLKGRDVSSAK